MEAAIHFRVYQVFRGTGVVRYSLSVSAPGKDVHNVDTFLGGFYLKCLQIRTDDAIWLQCRVQTRLKGTPSRLRPLTGCSEETLRASPA
jgi:hypothetical protein